MADVWVTKANSVAREGGDAVPVIKLDGNTTTEKITFTTATSATAFGSRTRYVRLYADAAFHLSHDGTAATANDPKHAADTDYWYQVDTGQALSFYDGTS